MEVKPQHRLSADECLKHSWLADRPIVEKATKLIDSQRRKIVTPHTSALEGILPSEWSQDAVMKSIPGDSNGGFKRPMESEELDLATDSKRVKRA